MWQQLIVALIVVAAAVYAGGVLGPRRWRRRAGVGGTSSIPGVGGGTAGQCGCGKDDGGCH